MRGVRGVRGRARPRAGSAEQGGAASAAHNPQRRPSPAARRWVGRTASPPAGSPLVACRPPSARKPARSRGAAPEPERESPADPTPGLTRGVRDLDSLPPRDPAAAPLVSRAGACGRPPTALRRDPGSSGRPGEWLRAAPELLPGPAACLCFCCRGAAGFVWAAPWAIGKARAGKLVCGEKWDRCQEAPPAPRAGWEQVARAGPGALCQGAEIGSRRPRLPRPLPSLPSPALPGGRTPGRPGNGAGIARNVPLGTALLEGGEKVAAEVREPRGGAGAAPPASWRGMLPAMRVPPGQALHSSAAPLEVGCWVGVCAEKEELGRPDTSGAGSDRCRELCFPCRGPWGAVVPGSTSAGDVGLGATLAQI